MTVPVKGDHLLSRRDLFSIASMAGTAVIAGGSVLTIGALPAGAADRASDFDAASLPWPERGNFASKLVVGPQQPSARAMVDEKLVLGLPREGSFFYGSLRDEHGDMYEVVRRLPGATPGGLSSLIIQSNAGKDTLRMMPEIMAGASTSDKFRAELSENGAVWRSAEGSKGKPFEMTMSANGEKVSWKEDGLMDVSGRLLGPGLQWFIPDLTGSQLYVSQIYEMNGTVLGKRVRGVMAFDQNYLPAGEMQYSGKDPLFGAKEHHRCWYTWGTRYKDGSYDAGHFLLGTDRMGFALLTNERQELTLNTDVSGDITLVPGGVWPKRIEIEVGEVRWEFLPDPRGRMPDFLSGDQQAFTPQNEGRWRRAGDTREPDVWFAWGEVMSGPRTAYSRNFRF